MLNKKKKKLKNFWQSFFRTNSDYLIKQVVHERPLPTLFIIHIYHKLVYLLLCLSIKSLSFAYMKVCLYYKKKKKILKKLFKMAKSQYKIRVCLIYNSYIQPWLTLIIIKSWIFIPKSCFARRVNFGVPWLVFNKSKLVADVLRYKIKKKKICRLF